MCYHCHCQYDDDSGIFLVQHWASVDLHPMAF